uniref:DNA/RNA non-specific endonuclease/pyrophosphatase/phosphodiesterase domain-containing protein n=1 Tax=Musca domestica TaxID=7370 RepID=A0A1I8NHU4_MUSDO
MSSSEMVLPLLATCHLNNIRNEWHVILEFKNEELKLLRQEPIANGTVLYMVCNMNDIVEMRCENGQLISDTPLNFCYNHLRPELKAETDSELCRHQLYRVGYNIRCRDRDYFFTTYSVCFDHQKIRSVFTISEAYPFVQGRPFGMQFDPDEIFTMNIFSAYNKRNIFANFQNRLGHQQSYMSPDEQERRFDRGHLTAAGDFMTNTLIASTFKMINVIPQFHAINDGNWRLMEEWARSPANTPSKVCSGAFNYILHLTNAEGQEVPIFFLDERIPVPLWTFKVVLDRNGERTVFVQYNNIHDSRVPPQLPADICRTIACPSTLRLTPSNFLGYTYCCDPGHFMNQVMPNLRGYC